MLGGKSSFPFDNRQQADMGQNFKVNLLSWILLRISLVEPKAKSKKMSPTDPVQEEENAEAEVEVEARTEKEEENLRDSFAQGHQRYTPTTVQCCYP
jgi:hypothetical protein